MGNWVIVGWWKLNMIFIVGWKPYMLTRLPSLTHSVLNCITGSGGRAWDGWTIKLFCLQVCICIYICWMTCNVIIYALWSVSEHDIPSFDYIMKCISWRNALINIILSCFVLGTNSATLSNQKDLLWNYFKSIYENRSFLAEILGMSQLVSEH